MEPHALVICLPSYFYVYALCQIPAGILADHLGPKRPLFWGCAICTLGSLIFPLSHSFSLAITSRALVGLGSVVGYICCLKLIVNWFPANRFGFMCGLVNMVAMIGAFFGEVVLSYLIAAHSWRPILLELSIIGGINAILILLIVRDYPKKGKHTTKQSHVKRTKSSIKADILKIISSPQIWLLSIYVATMYCTFDTLAALWGVPYLQGVYHINNVRAATISSFIFLGAAFGYPVFGWLTSNLHRKHKILMIIASTATLLVALAIYSRPTNLLVVTVLFFALGVFSAATCTGTTLVKENMPLSLCGVSISIMNTVLVITGALSQPLFGFLLEMSHRPPETALNVLPVYDFQRAFLLMPCLFAISLLCAILIKQTKSQCPESRK